MNRLITVVIMLGLFSCKPIYKSINGINKNLEFSSFNDYKSYIIDKTNLNTKRIFFINNNEYNRLINHLIEKKITYYYGIAINKNILISGSNLKDKNSCLGSIVTEVSKKHPKNEFFNHEENLLLNFSYENFENEKMVFHEGKKIIIFIYSYKLGSLANNISAIIDETSKNQLLDYVIISIDNNDIIH